MPSHSQIQKHDSLTQVLHWMIALLVIGAYGVGLWRETLPKNDFRAWLLSLHMSVGLVVVGLTLVRIFWRSRAPHIASLESSPAMVLASKLAHGLLYLLLIALPVVGLVAAWTKGRTVGIFGLPLPSPFAVNVGFAKQLEEVHEVLAHGLMMLAGVHAVAAIYHHLLLKDATLARMVPMLKAPSQTP